VFGGDYWRKKTDESMKAGNCTIGRGKRRVIRKGHKKERREAR